MPGGRPPKPRVLKLLAGTLRKDRDTKRARPKAPAAGAKCPSPPSRLGKIAKEEWRRVAPFLFRRGLLTRENVTKLAAYCQSCGRWWEYEKVIDEQGATFTTEKGYVCQRPEVTLSQKERTLMRQMATDFGLSPASPNFGIEEQEAKADPAEAFIFGGKKLG